MIVIEGAYIPKDCNTCPYNRLSPNDYPVCCLGATYVSNSGKPKDCPIVGYIPDDHGRILYEDGVLSALHRRIEILMKDEPFRRKCGHIDMYGLIPMILDLPDVLEAGDSNESKND
jgi:hypothetical protein